MYQKYSIGTMAKLMGISAEAIRYYESRTLSVRSVIRKQLQILQYLGFSYAFKGQTLPELWFFTGRDSRTVQKP